MVTKYPDAKWRPLGPQTQPLMSSHDIICLHTMVGYLTSTDNMFKQNGYSGTESHFGVGGKWGSDVANNLDGVVYQWQDLERTADANFEGNHHVISIETADNAPQSASNLAPWTSAQLDSIVTLIVWLCRKFSIPAILVQDSRPGRRGIAVHRQGIEHSDGVNSHPGWLVSGGERWSTVRGKECPGDARIKQVTQIIIPRVQDILNGDEVEMVKADWDKLTAMLEKFKAETVQEVHDEVVKILTSEEIFENVPTNVQLQGDPTLKPTPWTLKKLLRNLETDNDNDRDAFLIPIKEAVNTLIANATPAQP